MLRLLAMGRLAATFYVRKQLLVTGDWASLRWHLATHSSCIVCFFVSAPELADFRPLGVSCPSGGRTCLRVCLNIHISVYSTVHICSSMQHVCLQHGRIWVHRAACLHGYRKVAHFSHGVVSRDVLPWCPSGLGQGSKLAT